MTEAQAWKLIDEYRSLSVTHESFITFSDELQNTLSNAIGKRNFNIGIRYDLDNEIDELWGYDRTYRETITHNYSKIE